MHESKSMARNSLFSLLAAIPPVIFGIFMLGKFSYASVTVQEKAVPIDNIIGSTFKTLAKAFVSTSDIEKIKKNNIEKLKKMDEANFRKRYNRIFNTIKDAPFLKDSYGLTQDLTKQEAIEKICSLDKKKIYAVLNSVPNTFIANQFRLYLTEKKQEIQKSNIAVQIRQLWNKIKAKACIK